MNAQGMIRHAVAGNIGRLLIMFSALLAVPILVLLVTAEFSLFTSFAIPAVLSFLFGILLYRTAKPVSVKPPAGLLVCGLGWIVLSVFGCLPYVLGIQVSFLDAYFETVSGFTTTGITVFSGLDSMPASILFWRGFTQWLGGLGIITFFLVITFRGGGFTFRMFNAESHKISSGRPTPSIYNTVRILWTIYIGFSLAEILLLMIAGMSFFDAMVHTFTTISTGGFSNYDASIGYFSANGYVHFKAIEYILILFMTIGGINFLIHYQVFKGDIKALWKQTEMKYFWRILLGGTAGMALHMAVVQGAGPFLADIERNLRTLFFTSVSILTTTGFGTVDINNAMFPAAARQILILFMLIGGCVGSTGGGIKVLRVAILWRLFMNTVYRITLPRRSLNYVVIDGKPVPKDEVHKVAGLFFGWLLFIAAGGFVTAVTTDLPAWSSFSGMFSAMGNIGPCFIPPEQMAGLPGVVKIVYIIGMLAGRLEILPIILLFMPRSWR